MTPRGPKVVDFGRAKTAAPPSLAGVSFEPTQPADALLTDPGVTVGTVAYMSPEQLRGEPLDTRTDLFSLGLVLYEMAVGRPAFAGATTAVVSAAILHDQPVAPQQIRPDLPHQLEDILLKALEKDRDVRYQHASELRADLKRLKRQIESHAAAVGVGTVAPNVSTVSLTRTAAFPSDSQLTIALIKRHRGGLGLVVAALAVAIAVAKYVVRRTRSEPAATLSVSVADLQIVQLTTSGNAERPAISPDGRYVAYIQSPDGFDPLVTPDDRRVIFLSNRTGTQSLWMQSLDGGTPTSIANVGVGIQSFAVSPDSRSLVFRSSCCSGERKEPTLVICEFPECATRRALPSQHYAGGRVRWTPDGRSLAYVDADTQSNIWIQPLAAGTTRQLTHFTDVPSRTSHGRMMATAWRSRAPRRNHIVLFKGLKR